MTLYCPSLRSLKFHLKYFKNADRCDVWVNSSRIGSHPWDIDWHNDVWRWMTLNSPSSRSSKLHVKYFGSDMTDADSWLRQISAYNVSTARDSEKIQLWRIGNRLWALQWAIDVVRRPYVTPKSHKGWLKTDFSVIRNNIQFQSNKVCYKVLSCENFQRHSCRAVNQLWNNRKI